MSNDFISTLLALRLSKSMDRGHTVRSVEELIKPAAPPPPPQKSPAAMELERIMIFCFLGAFALLWLVTHGYF